LENEAENGGAAMSEPKTRSLVATVAWAIALLFVAVLLYGASYAMLVSEETVNVAVPGAAIAMPVMEGSRVKPHYAFGSHVAVQFYGPAHEVDVWLRPEKWLPTLDIEAEEVWSR
jgi:hypothetical protein